ncbi:Mbeg1-like protein [Streptococcus dentiloxodontae]
MANIYDYILTVKDKTFEEFPLNLLDKTCLNEIGYIFYGELLSQDFDLHQKLVLKHLLSHYSDSSSTNLPYNFTMTKERVQLFEAMIKSKRFADLELSHYINDVDTDYEKQFAAMIFSLPELAYHQIVFRGTDDSLVGWQEDFRLTYMREIPAHRSAISYLKRYLPDLEGQIVISGHSKGGNLALYAAAHLTDLLQGKIAELVLLDSPGLMKNQLSHAGYQQLRSKMTVIRPQDSIVGVMLYLDVPVKIVQSSGISISQHKTTNWQVDFTGDFLTANQPTELSNTLEKTFKEWTEILSNRELKILFDTLFGTLMDSGIESIDDLKMSSAAKLPTVLQSFRGLGQAQKAVLLKSASQFISVFWNQADFVDNQRTKLVQNLPQFPFRERLDRGKDDDSDGKNQAQ